MMDIEEYAEDPLFESLAAIAEHSETAYGIVSDSIAKLSLAECKALLSRGTGQWAPVQDAWEIAHDEALTANGRIANVVDAEGNTQQRVASPVKFDDDPAVSERAPQFAELVRRLARSE